MHHKALKKVTSGWFLQQPSLLSHTSFKTASLAQQPISFWVTTPPSIHQPYSPLLLISPEELNQFLQSREDIQNQLLEVFQRNCCQLTAWSEHNVIMKCTYLLPFPIARFYQCITIWLLTPLVAHKIKYTISISISTCGHFAKAVAMYAMTII